MATYTSVQDGAVDDPTTWGETILFPIATDSLVVDHYAWMDGNYTFAGVTANTGGKLEIRNNFTLTLPGGAVLDGGTIGAQDDGGTIDTAVAITGTGTIDWAMGLDILGALNGTFTHVNMSADPDYRSTLTVDITCTFAPGAITGVNVVYNAVGLTVTTGGNYSCNNLTLTGGFLSGLVEVTGYGNFACNSVPTATGILWIQEANGTLGSPGEALHFKVRVLEGITSTLTAAMKLDGFDVRGTLACGSQTVLISAVSNNCLSVTGAGAITGTGLVTCRATPSGTTQADPVLFGAAQPVLFAYDGARAITFNNRFQCGTLGVYGNKSTTVAITAAFNGGLDCGTLTIGRPGDKGAGIVTIGGVSHIGAVALGAGNTDTAGTSTLTYGGQVYVGGNQTLAGLTVALGAARLYAGGVTINGTSVTALTAAAAIVTGGSANATLTAVNPTGTLYYRGATLDTCGASVLPLVPHWALGIR